MTNPLDSYLRREGVSESDFATKVQRDRSIVNKLRSGKLKASVELALAIERETAGAVDAGSLNPAVAAARVRPDVPTEPTAQEAA